MPVTKKGKKFYVKDIEYDTEDAANKAYMKYLDVAMGVKPVDKPKPKGKSDNDAKTTSQEKEVLKTLDNKK